MELMQPIWQEGFKLATAIKRTRERGYYFAQSALSGEVLEALESEINTLPLEVADHINHPLNLDKPNQVQQQHARAYFEYGDTRTPVANLVIAGLTEAVQVMKQFPKLAGWQLNEIGYQHYRGQDDWIGPHRDRASDKLLSVTLTITGSAPIRIFKTLGHPSNYSLLEQTREFITEPGSAMFLRAPGFGNSKQIIHQVLPPTSANRTILNLRMRPTILESPQQKYYD